MEGRRRIKDKKRRIKTSIRAGKGRGEGGGGDEAHLPSWDTSVVTLL